MFNKIVNLILMDNHIMLCGFKNHEWRRLDLKPLINKYPPFKVLKKDDFYKKGKIDLGGFGVIWNDDIDISSDAIFEQGEKVSEICLKPTIDISAYLKELRNKSHLSQNDLSHLSGVSQSTIARIEKGEIDPTLGTVKKIIAPFGLKLVIS